MDRRILALLAATLLLGAAGCTANRVAGPSATAPMPAQAQTPSAPPETAPATSPPTLPAITGGNLAALNPGEIRVVMLDLNLAHTLEICGFPALGSFMRDYTQKRIDTCPNSAERKATLHSIMESTALREQRQGDEARAKGDTLHCYAGDTLVAIKEMIPIAQRVVARAEKPMDCGDISSAQR